MIVANVSHTLINCTCKNRLGFSLLPFTLIPQYLKRFNWSIQWNPLATHLWLVLVGFHDFQTLPDVACVKRGRGETYFRSQSLSSESAVKYPHVGPTSGDERFKYSLSRENKIGQMPYPRANKDNQIPTPYPAYLPPRRLYIDRCIIIDKLFIQTLIIFLLRNSLVSLRYLWRNVPKKRHARAKLLFF